MGFRNTGDSNNGDREDGGYRKDNIAEELDLLRGVLGKGIVEVGLDDDADDEEEDGDAADESPDSNGEGK